MWHYWLHAECGSNTILCCNITVMQMEATHCVPCTLQTDMCMRICTCVSMYVCDWLLSNQKSAGRALISLYFQVFVCGNIVLNANFWQNAVMR